jgi:hypothetical protein
MTMKSHMRSVKARFPTSSGTFSYYIPVGDAPKVGDMIVTSVNWVTGDEDEFLAVMNAKSGIGRAHLRVAGKGGTDEDEGNGFDDFAGDKREEFAETCRVATIIGIEEPANPKATKFYMKLLSITELREAARSNKRHRDAARAREEARQKLERMLKDTAALDLYKRMAETNPEAAALLKIVEGE